ncbi:MAG: adenylate/guanylate cyclase domain-containing protein [Desulfobacteraceae bacterium]|nr:adenylate/guanylate cyclase domain-containing protein [Desulfobacteraceae bacterium]
MPDIDKFERIIFRKKNTLDRLLSFSLKLLEARHVGLLQGTDKTYMQFLPPGNWDRGVMHKFDGKGFYGLLLKYFGTLVVRIKGLSPVRLYKSNQFGEKEETDGIISYVLKKHAEFYEKGVKILIIDNLGDVHDGDTNYSDISILSYNGEEFKSLPTLKINNAIVKYFKAKNFVSAYIPDFGAIVFNTIDEELLLKNKDIFIHEALLKRRLNMLISAIEMASLANIGFARGRQAAHIIWRKEKNLRKTALQLKQKEIELNAQKEYLRAVGAVNEQQLNMEAVNVTNGVYAFMDMVGSATIRKNFSPRDYFYILNLCHQIAANNAYKYSCRVDNFMGDAVFFETASPFDDKSRQQNITKDERLLLMIFVLASTFNELNQLKKGLHEKMDKSKRVQKLISETRTDLAYRAGLEMGPAMIGPLGSNKRRVVTAIGKTVNNASRLESTGSKYGIHISKNIFQRLENAYITSDNQILWKIISQNSMIKKNKARKGFKFLDAYKIFFGLENKVISEIKNVSYKEYTEDISYLIKCIPDEQKIARLRVCSG